MKLIENISLWNTDIAPIKIEEQKVITEAEKQEVDILGGYKVPIWVLDTPNLNGRIYTSGLAEKIVNEGYITYAFDGHPEEEVENTIGEVKGIGKNPVIEEGVLWVEAYFVDEDYYSKIERILNHNSKVGLSSVGYGELDEDGKIIEDTYTLVRYFDFVLNPSYNVYIKNDNEKVSEGSKEETGSTASTEAEEQSSTEDKVSDVELETIQTIKKILDKKRSKNGQ